MARRHAPHIYNNTKFVVQIMGWREEEFVYNFFLKVAV